MKLKMTNNWEEDKEIEIGRKEREGLKKGGNRKKGRGRERGRRNIRDKMRREM